MRRAALLNHNAAWTAASGLLAVACGVAVGAGHALPVGFVLGAGLALAAGILDWRRSIFLLLVYLPVSGVLAIALYPDTTPGVLAKDIVFVIPAYVGFLLRWVADRRSLEVPGLPIGLLMALVFLVLAESFNPDVPDPLVALIGARTWLLYLPLLVLGFHLVHRRAELDRLLLLLAAAGALPLIIGIVEAVLIYTGHPGTVYSFYGGAASAVTQSFAEVSAGTGSQVRRVSSTFTFNTQFYSFTASMVAVYYAVWRGVLIPRGRGRLGAALVVLAVLAAMLSGARSAFLLIPVLLVAAVVLDRGTGGRGKRIATTVVAVGIGFVLATSLLGSALRPLLGDIASHAVGQFQLATIDGFRHGLDTTTIGLGTGVDTISARYAVPREQLFQVVGGTWQESWWVKALLELGVAGLLATAFLMGRLALRSVRITSRLEDPGLRAIAAALTAYVIWGLISSFKGQYLDVDPMNVYFWLFLGLLLRLPFLDRAAPLTAPP